MMVITIANALYKEAIVREIIVFLPRPITNYFLPIEDFFLFFSFRMLNMTHLEKMPLI